MRFFDRVRLIHFFSKSVVLVGGVLRSTLSRFPRVDFFAQEKVPTSVFEDELGRARTSEIYLIKRLRGPSGKPIS